MIRITKKQIEKILRKMESKGAAFIQLDPELISYDGCNSWNEETLVIGYSEDKKSLGIIMKINAD